MTDETGWFPTRLSGVEAPEAGLPGPDVGVVRDVKQRTESHGSGQESANEQVLAFRVERFDADGNRRPSIAVEMRGESLWGVVSDGDWVQLAPEWSAAQTVRVAQLHNVTTGSLFGARARPKGYPTALAIAGTLIGWTLIAVGMTTSSGSETSPLVAVGLALFVGTILVFGLGKAASSVRRPATGPVRRRIWPRVLLTFSKIAVGIIAVGAGVVIALVAGISRWFG